MTIDWQPLCEIVQNSQRFVLTSHVRPDGDALGSELGMAGVLEALGKDVRIINPSAAPPHLAFLDPSNRILKVGAGISEEEAAETDVLMVLDTSSWAQLQGMGRVLRRTKAKKVVIDHHVSADELGATEFRDSTAEATGSLVYRFSRSLSVSLTPTIATALYCAIATDTGWFRFPSTTGETMRTIADLIDLGAKPNVIYQSLYEQFTLARIRLAGLVLGRVAIAADGNIAYTIVTRSDFAETGAHHSDTEDLVNDCLGVRGVACAFIVIEQDSGQVKVSLRSRGVVDVAKVAEQFGGGGHKLAAGATLPGPVDAAVAKVTNALQAAL